MFKRKRKEKAKRSSSDKWIALLILLLLIIGGAGGYWFYKSQKTAATIAAEPPVMQMSEDCSYSQGFGSRENSELAAQLDTLLRDAGTGIKMVTVTDNLVEFRNCGDAVEPIYQTCSLLTINLPIDSRDPSEGDLGREIASILDVLATQNSCSPVDLSIVFETPNGSITWQMSYALALEAYRDGARGVELYDPSARR